MKTTLLFSVAILLSVATIAQTTVKNQETIKSASTVQSEKGSSEVKSAGSVSSATSIQSNAASSAEHKTHATAEKSKNEIAAEKKEAVAKAKTEEQEGKKAVSKDVTVSANVQSYTKVAASENNNKTEENASLNNQASVSSTSIKNSGNQMKEKGKVAVSNSTASAVVTGTHVKTGVNKAVVKTGEKVNAASATTIKAGSPAAHSIKPGSAPLKMNTHVKTNSGIRIN